ncbi:hypothetical protein JB92DRAFT_2952043, partial [Gautieria morchelliformis]
MAPRAPPVNIESGFFYFKCPQTQEDLETFWARLRAYKKASFEAPIHPGHVLAVTKYMGSYHGHPSPGTRQLPRLVRQCTGYNVTMPLLVLQARIQGGDAKWSQVWKGFMTSQNFPDVAPVPVIIKLFQESYLGFVPTLEDLWGNLDYAEWLPGARLAANEAWAYDRMRALQGKFFTLWAMCYSSIDSIDAFTGCSVPWSYGFCKVFAISSAEAGSHIAAVPTSEWRSDVWTCYGGDRAPPHPRRPQVNLDKTKADAVATALHDMHGRGVVHNDIKRDNLIIHHNPSNQD